MFKFLLESKFLGFVEAPVGVFFLFLKESTSVLKLNIKGSDIYAESRGQPKI